MKKGTVYEEYMKDKELERLMAQEDLIMDVTEAFCEILADKNIKRSSLAKTMGKTKGYVSQVLNGGRNITLRTIADIAYYLGYSVKISFMKKEKERKQQTFNLIWSADPKQANSNDRMHLKGDYFADDYSSEKQVSRMAG